MACFFSFWKWPIYLRISPTKSVSKVCSHTICKVPPFTPFKGYFLESYFILSECELRSLISVSQFQSNSRVTRVSCHVFSSSIQMLRISGFDVYNIISTFSSQSRPISNSISTRSTGPCMCPRAQSKLTFSSKYTHYHVWKLKLLECQPLI